MVVLGVRYASVEISVLLFRLLWAAACLLWKLACNAGSQVLVLASSVSRRELVSAKDDDATGNEPDGGAALPDGFSLQNQEESEGGSAEAAELPEAAETEVGAAKDSADEESADATAAGEDLVLRCLWLPAAVASAEGEDSVCQKLKNAVAQVRAAGHRRVRFSVQVESERPASVAVLGAASNASEACKALAAHVGYDMEERAMERIFLVHFTMRESWDLPQDDELVDASIASDWVDLGNEVGATPTDDGPSEMEDKTGEDGMRSPQAVLRKRLREVFLDREDVHVFMDDNPFATSQKQCSSRPVRVDFAGMLPDAWDAVARAVLACEARGVYLSRSFEVLFWCSEDLREHLSGQVESALSHCQGTPERISRGSLGFGITGCDLSGFEDLSDNVSAVLSGHTPPGWHRMEWTPHGAGAVSHLTY